jgi:nitroimidazol reductase NimA-like FMN-containing flavoprotein (pyridoxamine 5'-phosphate oxidase superfamily)
LTYWLATTSPDGRPHVAGVGAIWSDGKIYVVSGPGTRKSRNMTANPHCVLSVSLHDIDLVVEGTAAKVTDARTLEQIARRYADGGWPAEARDGALVAPYSAPSAGPPPWDLYEVTPVSATGVASAEPHGATRWRFAQ